MKRIMIIIIGLLLLVGLSTKTLSFAASTYQVYNRIPVYSNSYDASKKINVVTHYAAGTYSIFREYNGLINITRVAGKPGGWINPSENSAKPPVKPPVTKEKVIAFTFDDGPSDYTRRILDKLQGTGDKVTFFLLGNRVSTYPNTIRRMASEGHEIGNHSWSHPDLTGYSYQGMVNEINRTDQAIMNVTGRFPRLFRPPYGARNSRLSTALKARGKAGILWSVDTLDWRYRDSEYVKNYILNHAYDGAVVLLHDIHETSVRGFTQAYDILKARGYRLVRVSTLYYLKGKPLPTGQFFSSPN